MARKCGLVKRSMHQEFGDCFLFGRDVGFAGLSIVDRFA